MAVATVTDTHIPFTQIKQALTTVLPAVVYGDWSRVSSEDIAVLHEVGILNEYGSKLTDLNHLGLLDAQAKAVTVYWTGGSLFEAENAVLAYLNLAGLLINEI